MCVDIVRRLKLYMEHIGLPSTQFADYAKIARPTISQLLNGRNRKVSNELIEKLHTAFPDLNIMWLMFGDGNMIISPEAAESKIQPTLFNDHISTDNDGNRTTPDEQTVHSVNLRMQDSGHSKIGVPETKNEANIQIPIKNNGTQTKKIQTIMVCYTDNSFEIFTPAQ